MSTKQVSNTKAPKADSSKSNEQEAPKGNTMATAEKTNTQAPEAAAPATAPAAPALTKAQKDEIRFQELLAKDGTELGLSDEEEAEYLKLRAARKQAIAGRRKILDELVAKIVDSGFTFKEIYQEVVKNNVGLRAEVTSLFSAEEISKAAGKSPKGSGGRTKTKTAGASDASNVLIAIKGEGPRSTTFSKKDRNLLMPKEAFRKLWEGDKANFAENLKKHYKPGAEEYFQTEEGKQDLAYLIDRTTRDVAKRSTSK